MNGQSPILFHSKNFEICRICMRKPESDRNIVYTKIFGSTLKGFQLKSLILECLGVEVNKDDNKPKIICIKCLKVVIKWIRTKKKAVKSQHIMDGVVTKKLKQLTGDKMEIDDENEYNTDKSSSSAEKSKTFDDSDIDIISHNTHEIRSNEDKYGDQLPQYSQNSTEGRLDIELHEFQKTVYQRPLITRLKPCPLVIAFNNNQLSENSNNTVKIEMVKKKTKYEETMSSDLNVQTSELLNSSHLAVSNSKKSVCDKKKMNNNLQITPEVDREMNALLSYGQNVCYNSDVLKVTTSTTNGTKKNERKCIQRISNLGSPDYNIFDGIIDASEPRYCICDQVSFGTMVACDNKACITEWFHTGCVGVIEPPRGKWYCPKCRNTVTKHKRSKKSMNTS